jgi:DNA-binding transcriptional ArsR family regulator
MLLERFIAYLSQKEIPITREHLCNLATEAGYTKDEISTTLKALANHEYILREEWDGEPVVFKWVKSIVEQNRNRITKKIHAY